MTVDADLVIAGAGCAGLSALRRVMHGPGGHRREIVIDRDCGVGDDRTWDRLRVRFPGWETVGQLQRPNGASPAG